VSRARKVPHPTTPPTGLPDRLEQLLSDEFKLDAGHSSFDRGHSATEVVAWLTGNDHTASPPCLSPVLRAFLQRLNDTLDDENRQRLKPYLPRCAGTAGDGKDELRGWLAADWAVRVAAPTWLELAGVTESAAALRALAPITDYATASTVRSVAGPIRRAMYARRDTKLRELRQCVRDAVAEELRKRRAAWAAWAAWAMWATEATEAAWAVGATEAAWAAWAAEAAEAAWADGAAGAAWGAWAAEGAGAAWGAWAAEAAGAAGAAEAVWAVWAAWAAWAVEAVEAAEAAEAAWAAWAARTAEAAGAAWAAETTEAAGVAGAAEAARRQVYDAVYAKVKTAMQEKLKGHVTEFLPSALELLDRMIDPEAAQ
jgi:hypothetical protein